jgi:hypothetical protein
VAYLLFVAAATVTGTIVGALLGWVGGTFSEPTRLASGSALGLVAITIASAELAGRGVRPLQCNRETPKRWVDGGMATWSTRTGAALGFGATSRLGYSLWYCVPLSALMIGDLVAGAVIYGLYAFVRTAAAVALVAAGRRSDLNEVADWLLARRHVARLVSAAQLLLVGLVVAVSVGI